MLALIEPAGILMRKLSFALALAFGLCLAAPKSSQAQVSVGPQVSIANDVDLGVGGRAMFGLSGPWKLGGSFDYFFPGSNVTYWELNGNAYYNLELPDVSAFSPYAGGGLNIARTSVDGAGTGSFSASTTDVGLNLAGGARFPVSGNVAPFAEVRLEVGGGEQLVVTGGLLF